MILSGVRVRVIVVAKATVLGASKLLFEFDNGGCEVEPELLLTVVVVIVFVVNVFVIVVVVVDPSG